MQWRSEGEQWYVPVFIISDASQDAVRQAHKTNRSVRLSPQPASPSRNLAMLIQV